MRESKKILKAEIPIVGAFPHQGALFSILYCRNECRPWIYNNFIQVYSLKNLYKDRSGTLDYFYHTYGDWMHYTLKANPWIKIEMIDLYFLKKHHISIIDFIRDCINDNKYLFYDIDKYYASPYDDYKKNHEPHEMLVYGYDDSKKIVYMSDNTTGKYNQDIISYDEINEGYNGILDMYSENPAMYSYREKVIYIMEVKKNMAMLSQEVLFNIDLNKIEHDLKEYLMYDFYSEKYKRDVLYVYGIDCYDELRTSVEYASDTGDALDYRGFYSFYDHKKLMLARIEYMSSFLDMSDIYSNYCELVNKFRKFLIMILKAREVKKPDYWKKVLIRLNEIKEQENYLLNRLLNVLEVHNRM